MKRVVASNVDLIVDDECGILRLDWTCPFCDFDNADVVWSHDVGPLREDDFETDQECAWCGKTATVECHR